jgi:DNA-binding NarL/FixJ family response regulator
MKKEIKILIADDHAIIRKGLNLMLEHQQHFIPLVTEVTNGQEVIDIIKTTSFDVILLDMSMPILDGLAVLKKMLILEIKIPVLVLTMHSDESIIKQALNAGATGYLLKNSGIEELVKAILTVIKNEKYYSNEIAQILFSEKQKADDKKEKAFFHDNLSKREVQILMLLVKEYSSQKIADELFISKRTIEGHRKNIMSKLGIKTTVGLVVYALQNGYY